MSVVELVTPQSLEEQPSMVDLFSIDGVMYQIPAVVSASLGLKFLWISKTKDEQTAAIMMLEELLGDEGFQALMNYKALKTEDLEKIMAALVKVLLGSVEDQAAAQGEGTRGLVK